jgi:hypothetical protein
MAGELLMCAARREITMHEEKLYLRVFARGENPSAVPTA